MRSNEFMRALPTEIQHHCDPKLGKFKSFSRAWLVQLHAGQPRIHYEVSMLPQRSSVYPQGSLEIGLHFEEKDSKVNARLLAGFETYLFEVREALGESWEAEPWDKGWSKVYISIPRETLNQTFLDEVARQMGQAINTLHPILLHLLNTD